MRRLTKLLIVLGVLVPVLVIAAPVTQYAPNLLPQANNTYDLGSTTPSLQWLHGYFSQLCIAGDCRTVWPSTSSSFPFTAQTYGNSTSTVIAFLAGLVSNGSTTVPGLSGFVGANNGLLFSFATSTIKTSQLTNDAGFLTSAVTSVTGTYPIISSGGTTPAISTAFGTTSNTGIAAGNLYIGSGGLLVSAATSSETCTAPLSCTSFDVLKNGGALTITQSGTGANGYLSSTDWNTFNNKISWGVATSTSPNQIVYTDALGKLVSVASSSLSLPNTALQNSSITINSTSVSLGGSITVSSTTLLSDVNTWSKGQTFNAGATTTSLYASASTTVSGTLNAVGGLRIQNDSNPTVSTAGTIAINTTAASTSLRFHDGTAERVLNDTWVNSYPVASTTALSQNGGYVIAASDVVLGNGTSSTTPQSCAIGNGTWTSQSASFAMGDHMYLAIGSTGTTTISIGTLYRPDSITQSMCRVTTGSTASPSALEINYVVRATAD